MDERYDVVVIGGGAAGLSGALALARARRSVLVIDAGTPRNAPAGHVHNYLAREGTPPAELLARRARRGGRLRRRDRRRPGHGASTGRTTASGVTLADGRRVLARRLLVTTGLVDELPDVPGWRERWGRDVLHCPYCHGWEVRDQADRRPRHRAVGVHQALLWRQWSADVTLFLHTGPSLDATSSRAARRARHRGRRRRGRRRSKSTATGSPACGWPTAGSSPATPLVVTPRFTARAGVLAALGPGDGRAGDGGTSSAAQSRPTPTGRDRGARASGWPATSPT